MLQTRDLAQIGLMTSFLIVLGWLPAIPLGFIPVPIVFQNLGVMLIGATMGVKKGSLTLLLFFLFGLVLPVFSGKSTTLTTLVGPTAGYVLAWALVPLLMGWLLSKVKQPTFPVLVAVTILVGVLFVDVVGSVWLSQVTNLSLSASLFANLAFLPEDLLKAFVACLIAQRISILE